MTVYADEQFYNDIYRQSGDPCIPPELFDIYARKGSRYIDQFVFGNLDGCEDVPTAVKHCCCELAETLYRLDNGVPLSGITTEKVGDVTISYAGADTQQKTMVSTVKNIVYAWLGDTGLLHRGGRLC